nr:cellulose-binding protein [uncultured bacterium]
MYDVGGFKHDDVTKVPTSMYTNPNFGGNTSIDYAELKPASMVRVGSITSTTGGIALTTSAGSSWWQGQTPSGVTSGGNVALSADGSNIVWAPGGTTSIYVSTTFGSTWTAIAGLPAGAIVEADRANPSKFYAWSGNTFYISSDKGLTFKPSAATNLPAARRFKAVYGYEGDIWLAGGSDTTVYGLWRSTDSGATFTKFANVEKADNVTFGKAAAGQTYPTAFIVGQVDGVRGVFRSTDQGNSWIRINDDQHQYGNFGDAISGDPRIFGRLYLGTNGRGLLYGDSAGPVNSSSSSSLSSSIVSSSSRSSSSSSVVTSSSIPASSSVAPSSSSRSSSSISSSSLSSSSISSNSSSACATALEQCNWYGTLYPLCVTTQSGWGYENNKSCISRSTCTSQPAPFGVTAACSTTSSAVSSSSVVSSSARSSSSSSISSIVSSSRSSSSISSSSVSSSSTSSTSGGVTATMKIANEWNSGYCASVTVTNNSNATITWQTSLVINGTLNNIWGASAVQTGTTLALKGLEWNATLQPGKSITDIGFCANK